MQAFCLSSALVGLSSFELCSFFRTAFCVFIRRTNIFSDYFYFLRVSATERLLESKTETNQLFSSPHFFLWIFLIKYIVLVRDISSYRNIQIHSRYGLSDACANAYCVPCQNRSVTCAHTQCAKYNSLILDLLRIRETHFFCFNSVSYGVRSVGFRTFVRSLRTGNTWRRGIYQK